MICGLTRNHSSLEPSGTEGPGTIADFKFRSQNSTQFGPVRPSRTAFQRAAPSAEGCPQADVNAIRSVRTILRMRTN